MRLIIILFILLTSCADDSRNEKPILSDQSAKQKEDIPQMHSEVEVVEEGDVPIEDQVEEDDSEPYIADNNLSPTADQRLNELRNDVKYIRNNGKLNRYKIAKQLNREGYTKSDGSEFRRRDIPKK